MASLAASDVQYCDHATCLYLCLVVYLYVRSHISKTTLKQLH